MRLKTTPQPSATSLGAVAVARYLQGAAGNQATTRLIQQHRRERANAASLSVQKAQPATLVPDEQFDTGPARIAEATRVVPVDYSQPIPGTTESKVENQKKTSMIVIHAPGATLVITPQQTVSTDTDNSLPSPYWIDDSGNTGSGDANVDNLSSGWPRTGPFKGEANHSAAWKDIHSCVRCPANAPPRIPIGRLTQHQCDYLKEGGVALGPPGKDGVRRPVVMNRRIVMTHQLKFADDSSPDPALYNDRVRNSRDPNAAPGGSVITVSADTKKESFGVSGDSQGKYNLEGSPAAVAAAGKSAQGFVSVYLGAANELVNRKGRIQVPPEAFTQAAIDAAVGNQYREWLATGGVHVLNRALHLAGLGANLKVPPKAAPFPPLRGPTEFPPLRSAGP